MGNTVKIRTLTAPQMPLTTFDPGEYLGGLEFYETDQPVTEHDRDGLAQFVHLLAFLALKGKSTRWAASTIPIASPAYRALESHFGQLDGWRELTTGENGLRYRQLASFLMKHYAPRAPK